MSDDNANSPTAAGNNGEAYVMPDKVMAAALANDPFRHSLAATLAKHDTAIDALTGRMAGVEQGVKTLQGEVHHGFTAIERSLQASNAALSSKLDRVEATPKLDVHKFIASTAAIMVMFSMLVGGIIWVTQSQFAGFVAKQDAINDRDKTRLDWQGNEIATIKDKIAPFVTPSVIVERRQPDLAPSTDWSTTMRKR